MATQGASALLRAHEARPGKAGDAPDARVVASYVRKLQRHRNHVPCFMTDARFGCMEFDCRWRADCMRLLAEYFR